MQTLNEIYYLLGNFEGIAIFIVIFLVGAGFGWFFKSRRFPGCFPILALFGLLILTPVFDILRQIDHWFFTVPFFAGLFLHPICSRIKK